jgi:hypothetical protein
MAENARLFALANIAMADAGIASWDAKYEYNYWRPITAIREADGDGNPDTIADRLWEPLGAPGGEVVPNFTPPFRHTRPATPSSVRPRFRSSPTITARPGCTLPLGQTNSPGSSGRSIPSVTLPRRTHGVVFTSAFTGISTRLSVSRWGKPWPTTYSPTNSSRFPNRVRWRYLSSASPPWPYVGGGEKELGVTLSCPEFPGHTSQDTPYRSSNCIGLLHYPINSRQNIVSQRTGEIHSSDVSNFFKQAPDFQCGKRVQAAIVTLYPFE